MKKSIKNLFAHGRKRIVTYDYSSVYSREDTIAALLASAKEGRQDISEYWKRMRRYYDGVHETALYSERFALENSIPFTAAQSNDGYIHVESQIDAVLPEFEFSPRGRGDGEKVRQREKIVRYICDRNNMEFKNSRNERRLGILGSAVWKVCWDGNSVENGVCGEVLIDNPCPEQIYPDPCAASVDDCEYIGYVYPMHREKARRIFRNELGVRGMDFDELIMRGDGAATSYLDGDDRNGGIPEETVRITEWWFRQPEDGSEDVIFYDGGDKRKVHYEYKAGDIALCILIGGCEVRYIPKYWHTTDCKMFPFVIYDRLPREKTLWGRSELEAIIPFIDAADREIAYAQLNSAFASNDIIVAEENALCDDCELSNSPGAVWKLRPGMMGKVQRLGNNAYSEAYLHANFDKWRDLMRETTGNFTVNQGNEPERVTTATGIALLNERSRNRMALKKIDKSAGFARLYELCDRTALEYYGNDRVVYIGASDYEEIVCSFGDGNGYVPGVDVKIHIGDGLANSKAFTISAVSDLMKMNIDKDNYGIVKSYLELIDLPMRQEICRMLDEKFGSDGDETEDVSVDSIISVLTKKLSESEEV